MFERYTEEARRVIFFARYEASVLASPYIELEHLWLGMMRETREMLQHCGVSPDAMREIRQEIEARSRAAQGEPKLSTSVDLPLSHDAKIALSRGAEEAEALQDRFIRPEHLFLGLLWLENSRIVQLLSSHGLVYDSVREQVALGAEKPKAAAPDAPSLENAVARLRHALSLGGSQLLGIDEIAAARPVKDGGWSPKQILGHLIDSASNNHQRFVRAMTQPELDWPNYEQEVWVKAQRYSLADWETLVKLWTAYNRHLLWLVLHIPEEKIGTSCRIGGEPPMTLGELISSYVDHLEHHLQQIPRRTGISFAGGL